MQDQINDFLEKDFYKTVEIPGYLNHVLYSDSVAKYTKIVIQRKNENYSTTITFDELWNELVNLGHKVIYLNDKEYIYINNEIKTLTYYIKKDELSLEYPQYIMRHKVNTELYSINPNNSNHLDITQNHSMLKYNPSNNLFDIIKPVNCQYMPIINNQFDFDCSINIDYLLLGLYYGDGSFSLNQDYPAISIGNRNEVVNFISNYIPNFITYDKTNEFDFYINYKKFTNMLNYYNLKGVKSENRIISDKLFNDLNYDHNKLLNFICGYYLADGSFNVGMITFSSSNYYLLNSVSILLNNIGIYSQVTIDKNNRKYKTKSKGDMYKLKLYMSNTNIINMLNLIDIYKESPKVVCKGSFFGKSTSTNGITRKLKNAKLKNIRALHVTERDIIQYNDYVYDICIPSTQIFIANGVLVHNTDSIFIKIPLQKDIDKTNLKNLWDVAEKSAEEINNLIVDYTRNVLLPRCNIKPEHNETFFKTELLMESILCLDVKKKYAYKLLVKEGNVLKKPKISYTGIEVIKSNGIKLTQDLLKAIIEEVALNLEVPVNQKREKTLKLIDEFYNTFNKCVQEFNIDYIGIPGKWSKNKQIIDGMKLYNYIMNEVIFEPGSAAKFIYTKPIQIKEFKNQMGICVPYSYNIDLLKEKFQTFNIQIDINTQWSKLFNITCERVINTIKQLE